MKIFIMNMLTKTGLIPALVIKNNADVEEQQKRPLLFDNISVPAPFGFRPFAEYQNPYSQNCSLLCNHPVDQNTKQIIKKPKNISEHKHSLNQLQTRLLEEEDDIFLPEVLFRRYTETDSRPQTPTPTVSAITRLSHQRRCITPDPPRLEQGKTKIVLDLRRSFSQNAVHSTLHDDDQLLSSLTLSSPIILKLPKEEDIPKKVISRNNAQTGEQRIGKKITKNKVQHVHPQENVQNPQTDIPKPKKTNEEKKQKTNHKKKKVPKLKDIRRDTEKEFKTLAEPNETQISTYNEDSSRERNENDQHVNEQIDTKEEESDSCCIDELIVKQLRRELNRETIENEFDPKRRKVLEEIYEQSMKEGYTKRRKSVNEEIKKLRYDFRLSSLAVSTDSILNLPRVFSRRNARFELPLDKSTLTVMTPLEYLSSHVYLTGNSRLLYNEVFKLHLKEGFEEKRLLSTNDIMVALGQIMGRPLDNEEWNTFMKYLDLSEASHIDFRTWCGICALCERFLGEKFHKNYLSRDEDPCFELEVVDFELLEKRLNGMNPNASLARMLYKIRDS